jgi:type IV fimbrial biogenesis protein FimT
MRLRRMRGFTIIELMVTLAIAGTMAALAVPSFKGMISSRAVQAESSALISSLHFAKAEAVKRSGPVTVCRTTAASPNTCAGTAGTWQTWMVFSDGGTRGTFDSSDVRLRIENGPTTNVNFASLANVQYLTFQATGIVTINAGATLPVTWTFNPTVDTSSSSYKRYQRNVCLNSQGRVSSVDGNTACST